MQNLHNFILIIEFILSKSRTSSKNSLKIKDIMYKNFHVSNNVKVLILSYFVENFNDFDFIIIMSQCNICSE